MDGRSILACPNSRLRLQYILEASALKSIRRREDKQAPHSRFDAIVGDRISVLRTCHRSCVNRGVDPGEDIVGMARSLTQSFGGAPVPSSIGDSISRRDELESYIAALVDRVREAGYQQRAGEGSGGVFRVPVEVLL